MRIGFWHTNRSFFFTSHQKGLNEDQIKQLKQLKVGDRLCLWVNNDKDGNSPDYTVKLLVEGGGENE